MTEDEIVGWHHQFNGQELSKLWETVKDRKPGVLQFMASQRVRHNLVTEQQQQFSNSLKDNLDTTFL